MDIEALSGSELDKAIASCMGHVGESLICFHLSGEIAMQLYFLYGDSIHRFEDGFHATMRHAGKLYTAVANDPKIAIYRAYVLSRVKID